MAAASAMRKYRWWAVAAVLLAAWAAWASYLYGGGYPKTPFLPGASGAAVTELTSPARLPELSQTSPYAVAWDNITGLHAQRIEAAPLVSGQPVLKLVAVPTFGWHRLGMRFTHLAPGTDYRISVWVKPDAARFVMLEARDERQRYLGRAYFDLVKRPAPSLTDQAKTAAIEVARDGWLRLSLDMPSLDGTAVVYCAIQTPAGFLSEYRGNGYQGLLFGGMTMTPLAGAGATAPAQPPQTVPAAAEAHSARAAPVVPASTPLAEIAPIKSKADYDIGWDGTEGLNIEEIHAREMVEGAPILALVLARTDGRHRIGERFDKLPRDGTYRVTAWVKRGSAAHVMLEARDRGQTHYGIALYDLAHRRVKGTRGDARNARIQTGADGWLRLSLDMRYEAGMAVIYLALLDGRLDAAYLGDGHGSVDFGGMELVSVE